MCGIGSLLYRPEVESSNLGSSLVCTDGALFASADQMHTLGVGRVVVAREDGCTQELQSFQKCGSPELEVIFW